MKVDFMKILKQDKEFEKYVREAALAILLGSPQQRDAILETLFNFYQIGLTTEQLRQWVKNNSLYGSQ